MKKFRYTATIFVILLLTLSSCSDFLEKPPSVDVTRDSVYNDIVNAERALNYAYRGIPFPLPYDTENRNGVYASFIDELTDIASKRESSWGGALNWYRATISIANYEQVGGDDAFRAKEQWFPDYYVNIRNAFLVADNIDRVPNASETYKKQIKAEAKLIAGINYYHMFKSYGSVPFVGHAIKVNEEVNAPRRPLTVYMDSVLNLLNSTVEDLPTQIPPVNSAGRLTRAAALAMIAKVHWYAASPLFNADQPAYPYPASDPDKIRHDSLICFMQENPDRWIEAANACKAAIVQAESEGWGLIDTQDRGADYNNDYHKVFNGGANRGRPEVIIGAHAYQGNVPYIPNNGVFKNYFRPDGWKMTLPTQNLVDMYDMAATGLPQKAEGSGFNPNQPFVGLDTRFYETVVHHRSSYSGSQWWLDQDSWYAQAGNNISGYLLRKFHPRVSSDQSVFTYPYLRIADLYLMYAECLNEAYGPSHPEIYEYMDKVRGRAGLPNMSAYIDKTELREKILKERAVELAFEESRYYDLRRWKRSDIFKTKIEGVKIIDKRDGVIKLERFDFSFALLGQQREFKLFWYYFPFPRFEVMKSYGLVQNPGWDDDNLVGIKK